MNKKLFSMAVLSIILLSGIGVIPVLAQSVSPASDFEYDLNGDGTGVVMSEKAGILSSPIALKISLSFR